MKRILLSVTLLASLLALSMLLSRSNGTLAASPSKDGDSSGKAGDSSGLESAILDAITTQSDDVLALLVFDQSVESIEVSSDGQWGKAYLVSTDPETGEFIPSEPGLVVAQRQGDTWRVYLPADPDWSAAVEAAPTEIFPEELKAVYLEMYNSYLAELPDAPLTGYYLPWQAGESRVLTQSMAHDSYTPAGTMHYAFDFSTHVHNQIWPLRASKAGTVWMFKNDVETCYVYPGCSDKQALGNYIVIQDITTSPVSYQMYLHLAGDSIPAALQVKGAPVIKGQFIGMADNTGQSWGGHIHFHVHTNPYGYFGTAVDITFEDVNINGGRPRIPEDLPYCNSTDIANHACDNTRYEYVSGNIAFNDTVPPSGGLTSPASDGGTITDSLYLAGWASDNTGGSGLESAQFMVKYNGEWAQIGPAFTAPSFEYTWNVCDSSVPDGPFSVALRVIDLAGNLVTVGAHGLEKDYACPAPPPTCQPGANEIILFDEADYAGSCDHFGLGNYASLDEYMDDTASAILVGDNVQATLFYETNYLRRGETFFEDDNNLKDNIVGTDSVSSLKVQSRSTLPLAPSLVSPSNGVTVTQNSIVTLFWENGGGATEYQVNIISGTLPITTTGWLPDPVFHVEGLRAGQYTWTVRGRNPTGEGPWSASRTFSIIVSTLGPSPAVPPYGLPWSDDFSDSPQDWQNPLPTGLWRWVDDEAMALSFKRSWWYQSASTGNYNTGQPNSGDFTSPRICLPPNDPDIPDYVPPPHYYLHFHYRSTTETQGSLWDQRWVQLSVDGSPTLAFAPFTNLMQLTDDVTSADRGDQYVQSKVIDLWPYYSNDETIWNCVRIRFHFETLDAVNNDLPGWGIDDFTITTTPPNSCSGTHEPNDSLSQATPLTSGDAVDANICPVGDFDYYSFTASAGDRISADIDSQAIGSPLDPYLYLIGSDGRSVLAENDDEIIGVKRDSFISFVLPESGTYYLKVRAWDHPASGSNSYFYTLRFYNDNILPVLDFRSPANEDGFLPIHTFVLTATASDTPSGIARVDFYWHDSDWINSDWQLIGSDTTGGNGWGTSFDPISQTEQMGAGLYARAYDWAHNGVGSGYWNLKLDFTPPTTTLQALNTTQTSTAFPVYWTGEDALSGPNTAELQWNVDDAGWQVYDTGLDGNGGVVWVVGQPGSHYAFRIRGVDKVGNTEAITHTAEVSTTLPLNLCTTPDGWEIDNTPLSANTIITGSLQIHTFCNPLSTDGLGDEDWITLTVKAGQHYTIHVSPLAESASASIQLYTGNGITLTLQAAITPTGLNQPSTLGWNALQDEVIYVRLSHADQRVGGDTVTYEVYIQEGYVLYLPMMQR